MGKLKHIILLHFTTITPEFEVIWKDCQEEISEACKRARDKKKALLQFTPNLLNIHSC